MKVAENQIYNLMDTNGRRNDIVNALQGYLQILDNILNEKNMFWDNFPKSSAQFQFYKQAIELSPDVFKDHPKYDSFIECLSSEENKDLLYSLENNNFTSIIDNLTKYHSLIENLDKNIEQRSRHYTSNLVKLGFTDAKRNISEVGKNILYPTTVIKDKLEELLPIDSVNIIYLRQLLKLKIFSSDKKNFYSPFCYALWLLLQKKRIDENDFFVMVQGINPYLNDLSLSTLDTSYSIDKIFSNYNFTIPSEFEFKSKIPKEIFVSTFTNKKSSKTIKIYLNYYEYIYAFNEKKDNKSLNELLLYYNKNKDLLKKAFGYGKNIFNFKNSNTPTVEEFLKENEQIFNGNLNKNLFIAFSKSKLLDSIKEYSDTTKRIFKASGIISFENGFVELAYRELSESIFDLNILQKLIFGNIKQFDKYNSYDKYEENINSYYCSTFSLIEIFNYSSDKITDILKAIQKKFNGTELKEIPSILSDKRSQEFSNYIEKTYPPDKVKSILNLFNNRSNDYQIKELVSSDSSIPTIYEYMIGIAWYYFSGKRINLLNSFNLTLSANFEPLMHAGGGQGDIVIYEKDKVIMLEATLMNTNSQKRGEWEPVLRHSANLKIEEESNNTGRDVTTFFIADTFDYNTINIWKAVSAVSLQSSFDKEKFTENVIIMPISTDELCILMDKSREYDDIIAKVKKLFEENRIAFDLEWRKKFIEQIV